MRSQPNKKTPQAKKTNTLVKKTS